GGGHVGMLKSKRTLANEGRILMDFNACARALAQRRFETESVRIRKASSHRQGIILRQQAIDKEMFDRLRVEPHLLQPRPVGPDPFDNDSTQFIAIHIHQLKPPRKSDY